MAIFIKREINLKDPLLNVLTCISIINVISYIAIQIAKQISIKQAIFGSPNYYFSGATLANTIFIYKSFRVMKSRTRR